MRPPVSTSHSPLGMRSWGPSTSSDGILEEQEEEHLSHAVMRQRQLVERTGLGKVRRGGLKSMLENLVSEGRPSGWI